jgi:predicted MFS family arabinose efflux permease
LVTTVQIAIAAGAAIGSIVVSTLGLAADFWLAGAIAVVGAVVLIGLGLRRSNRPPMDLAASS